MDAEDTKERIRQLRQKVGSDPTSIVPGQAFSPLTEERLKAVKSWQSVKASEKLESITPNNSKDKIYPIISDDVEEEFENRYQENLANKDQEPLAKSRTQMDDLQLLGEIDVRMSNNSKELIKFLDEKVRKIKEDIVSNESFDKYKEELEGSVNKNSVHLIETLESKVREVETALLEKNSNLAQHFSTQLQDLTENAQNEIGKAFQQSSVLQAILPDKMAEIENKIYSEFTGKINNLKVEISGIKDSFSLRNEVIGSELCAQIDDLGNKLLIENQKNEEARGWIKRSLDEKIDLSMDRLQADMVENLSSIEGDLENTKTSFTARNNEAESEFKSKVENLDNKVGALVTSAQTNFETQFQKLESDVVNLKADSALQSETIKSNLDGKFQKLESEVSDIRDSFSLRSEAMLSELSLQIDDIKQMVDLTAENAQKEDESMRVHFDEQVGSMALIAQTTSTEKYGELRTELGNLRNLFALRSEAISSEIGLRVDDLAASTDLNIKKLKRENDSVKDYFEKNIGATELTLQTSLGQRMQVLKEEIKQAQDSLYKQLETERFELRAQIEGIEQQVSMNAVQAKENNQNLKNAVEEQISSKIVTVKSSLSEKTKDIDGKITNSIGVLEEKIDKISLDLGVQVKVLDEKMALDAQKGRDEKADLKHSFNRIEEFVKSHLEKLESRFNKLDKDFVDNLKIMQVDLSESERRSLGMIKDKYRTLKSVVWEQLGLLKKSDVKFDEKIGKIEKRMISFDSLGSKVSDKLRTEHSLIKKYLKKELEKLSTSLKGVNDKILSESELQELFQNYTLNVNISRNSHLLSKTKRDFEKKNFLKKNSVGKKISKTVAIAVLLGSILIYLKTLLKNYFSYSGS
ncbi:MAG: hypothetical protein P8L82_10995 [Paracoccaceae bacterium]|nr:hypothetical protein [Paracoccaceae bacterium]